MNNIQDIGTEGLKAAHVPFSNRLQAYNESSPISLEDMTYSWDEIQGYVVDVTTFMDTERKYLQYYSESTGPR